MYSRKGNRSGNAPCRKNREIRQNGESMLQEIHNQVFRFNRFMAELLESSGQLICNEIGIRIAVVHDLVHQLETEVPEHEHPIYELAWVRSGAMTYVIDDIRIENTGENFCMVLIPPSTLHHRFSSEKLTIIRSAELQFLPHTPRAMQLLKNLPNHIREKGYLITPAARLRSRLAELDEYAGNATSIDRKIAEHLLYGSILELLKEFLLPPPLSSSLPQTTLTPRPELVRYIRMLVEDRINRNVEISDFSRIAGVGQRQFNRIFKAETGMTFNRYVSFRRLVNAEQMLKAGLTVTDVAQTLGFNSPSYFIAFFKQHRGMTPGEFQKMSEI